MASSLVSALSFFHVFFPVVDYDQNISSNELFSPKLPLVLVFIIAIESILVRLLTELKL